MSNAHLLIAHPEPSSLNYALQSAISSTLQKNKCSVELTDVYALWRENHPATRPYGLPRSEEDVQKIKQQQQIILNSDLTIIQFPLYWFSVPGLLKLYWEQVLEPGFAYPGKFKQSPLNTGRKILFSITTQSSEQDFSAEGVNGSIQSILYPLTVAFRFVGFNILNPFIAYNVTDKDEQSIKNIIKNLQNKISEEVTEPKIWLPV
jgi:NAD(P)H dehydrogenase (quinone)